MVVHDFVFSAGIRGKPIPKELRVNNLIRVPRVFVIDEEGRQMGELATREALERAKSLNLDLVEVNPHARPPVCKLMDYGKFKYQQSKSERDSKAKRKPQELREVKVRPKIDDHDFDVKVKTVERLIKGGDRVKVILRFKGREIVHLELAKEVLKRLFQSVEGISMVTQKPAMDGRQMVMVLSPKAGVQAQPKSAPQPAAAPAEKAAAPAPEKPAQN